MTLQLSTIPSPVRRMMEHVPFRKDDLGQSGAGVYLSEHQVLKIQPVFQESRREYHMLSWLQGRLSVPELLAYEERDNFSYLLMTRERGISAHDPLWLSQPEVLLDQVACALRTLWAVDIRSCPYLHTVDVQLEWAASNIANNRVDMDNVEPETFGPDGFSTPEDLLGWLMSHRPPEDIVFSHGDLSLPNILLRPGQPPAFIDLGRSGVGDRWNDIAIVHRSLQANWTGHYAREVRFEDYTLPMLLDRLHMAADMDRIRYFLLMDELF